MNNLMFYSFWGKVKRLPTAYIDSLYISHAEIIILSDLFTHSLEQIQEVMRPTTILN